MYKYIEEMNSGQSEVVSEVDSKRRLQNERTDIGMTSYGNMSDTAQTRQRGLHESVVNTVTGVMNMPSRGVTFPYQSHTCSILPLMVLLL